MSATDAAEQRTTTDTVKALDGFCPARVGDLDLDVSPPINMGLLGLGPIPKPYGLADFLQGRPFPSPPPVAPLPPPVVPSLPDFDDIVRIVGGAALRVLKKKDRGRCSRKRPLVTAAWPSCWGAADQVKHTVLEHVAKDGKAHGGLDHLDGRAAASLVV